MYIVAIYSICLADVSKAVHIIEKNCLFVVYRFSQEFFSHMDTSPRADDLDLFFAPHVRVLACQTYKSTFSLLYRQILSMRHKHSNNQSITLHARYDLYKKYYTVLKEDKRKRYVYHKYE